MKVALRALDKVEVVDDLHFRFLLNTPDVTLIPNRTTVMIASKSYYDRGGRGEVCEAPMGTGPYKFVRYEMGQYIDLERFEDYWGKKRPFGRHVFTLFPRIRQGLPSFKPER